jgi:hypothetical protein
VCEPGLNDVLKMMNGCYSYLRFEFLIRTLMVEEFDGHSEHILASLGVAYDHELHILVAKRLGTPAGLGLVSKDPLEDLGVLIKSSCGLFRILLV